MCINSSCKLATYKQPGNNVGFTRASGYNQGYPGEYTTWGIIIKVSLPCQGVALLDVGLSLVSKILQLINTMCSLPILLQNCQLLSLLNVLLILSHNWPLLLLLASGGLTAHSFTTHSSVRLAGTTGSRLPLPLQATGILQVLTSQYRQLQHRQLVITTS